MREVGCVRFRASAIAREYVSVKCARGGREASQMSKEKGYFLCKEGSEYKCKKGEAIAVLFPIIFLHFSPFFFFADVWWAPKKISPTGKMYFSDPT